MDLAQKLINEIDQIKDRLPDQNYKNLCDLLKDLSVDHELHEDLYEMHIVYYEANSTSSNDDYKYINFEKKMMVIKTPLKYNKNIQLGNENYYRHKSLIDKLKRSPEPQFVNHFELYDIIPNLVELGNDTVFQTGFRNKECNRCESEYIKINVIMPDIIIYCTQAD